MYVYFDKSVSYETSSIFICDLASNQMYFRPFNMNTGLVYILVLLVKLYRSKVKQLLGSIF